MLSVKSKLHYLEAITKAHQVIAKVLKKKKIKRWGLENIEDEKRLERILEETKRGLAEM
jgi:hypothetical protein